MICELSATEFHTNGPPRGGRPFLIRGLIAGCAFVRQPEAYLLSYGDHTISPSYFLPPRPAENSPMTIADFGHQLMHGDDPGYLHDFPAGALSIPWLQVMQPFPDRLLAPKYRSCWPKFARLFWCGPHHVTPLHFDQFGTWNLFFQIGGRKRFHLIESRYLPRCYVRKWKWSAIHRIADADPVRFPDFIGVPVVSAMVEPVMPYLCHLELSTRWRYSNGRSH